MNENLEARVIERINTYFLLSRKSSELVDPMRGIPLKLTPEVEQIAGQFLRGIDTSILEKKDSDLNEEEKKQKELVGWEVFWASEMAVAVTAIPNRGMSYSNFLPGRFMHYELLAKNIEGLLLSMNGDHKDLQKKSVIEVGSGSGMGLIILAQKGVNVTGLDYSLMANDFARYLATHYMVSNKVELVHGNYWDMPLPPKITAGQFDVSYTSGVLEHERDAKGLIAKMVEVTRPGGYVVIAVPNESSQFYKRFKEREEATKRRFPLLIRIPVEHRRYNYNIPQLMGESGLQVVRQDGLQIAPSAPIKRGDIAQDDLRIFDQYLPLRLPMPPVSPIMQQQLQPVYMDDRVNAWTRFELYTSRDIRLRYGWSNLYVGQKPQLQQPSGN